MAYSQAAMNAANKRPAFRTAAEQALVDSQSGDQRIRNADHEAKRQESIRGKK